MLVTEMRNIISIFVPVVILMNFHGCNGDSDTRKLTEHPQKRHNPFGEVIFDVWRFPADSPSVFRLWNTVQIIIGLADPNTDVKLYQSENVSEIVAAREADNRFLNAFFRKLTPSWNPSEYVNPFKTVFVGIEAESTYEIHVKKRNVDFRLAVIFLLGIALFFSATKLSRSATAFYAGSTALGVIGSLIIIVILLYRLVPKRSMAFTVLFGGWSVVAYVLYVVWSNFYMILSEYYRYVAIYLVSVASISFTVSYWWGPPTGVRTINLVRWAMQLIGLALVYCGCQIPEVAAATIVIMIIVKNLPRMVGRRLSWIRYRFFPTKRRLLTEDEYVVEGVRETQKALEELRQYCQSPKCDSWKMMSRLKSPSQFAEFVSGHRSHISDDEILRYSNDSYFDDDANEEDEESESGSSTYDLRSTPARGNMSLGNFEDGKRNGLRERFFQSQNIDFGAPSSAPPKLTRNGKFAH